MEKKLVAAIDIGTTKIVTLLGEKTEQNKVSIVAMSKTSSLGVERGIVKNAEKTAQSIKNALNTIDWDIKDIKEVWVGIAGQHVRSVKTQSSITFSEEKHSIVYEDIEQLIQDCSQTAINPNEQIVNISPLIFNTEKTKKIFSPMGEESSFLEGHFMLTIAQESSLENIKNALQYNGLKPKELILESIASAQAILTKEDTEQGIALIDIGGGTSDVAIFHKGSVIHSAVIPFGGQVITSDIMKAFDLDYQHAEALKVQYGSVLDENNDTTAITLKNKYQEKTNILLKDLNFVIKARVEEIIDLIQFQIEISGHSQQLNAGIILTGGGALLKNIKQLYQFHFSQQNVRIGIPNAEFFNLQTQQKLNQPIYSTATGLLLTGFQYEQALQERQRIKEAVEKKKEEPLENTKDNNKKTFDSLRMRLKNIFTEEDNKI